MVSTGGTLVVSGTTGRTVAYSFLLQLVIAKTSAGSKRGKSFNLILETPL